jgi:hypothetical protein
MSPSFFKEGVRGGLHYFVVGENTNDGDESLPLLIKEGVGCGYNIFAVGDTNDGDESLSPPY